MTIPANLAGILSTGNRDEPLTLEDYARLAQVNNDFDIAMAERLNELTPDQACALFDLARVGMERSADAELLAKIRTPGQPLDSFLELMSSTRENCLAEVKHCESRCEDDVIAISRQCLELVENVMKLLRGDR